MLARMYTDPNLIIKITKIKILVQVNLSIRSFNDKLSKNKDINDMPKDSSFMQ